MKILKIQIDGFGKLHQFEVEPDGNVTVFFGHNEAGKTTLHLFIRSMFYGASTKRRLGLKSVYERMRPWNDPEVYRGSMEIEFEGDRYLIERDFSKAPDDLTVSRLTEDGPAVCEEPEKLMERFLNGMSETAYVNTVSAGQLGAAVQRDLSTELRKYASNVSGTMNPDLDADRAVELLQKEKSRLEEGLDQEAARERNRVLGEIRKIEEELGLPEFENNIPEYKETVSRIRLESDRLYEEALHNQEELERAEEKLRKLGFSGSEEVRTASESVEASYADYQALQAKAKGNLAFFLGVLLLITAACAAGAPWFLHRQDLMIVGILVGAAFLVLALICFYLSSGRKKDAALSRASVSGKLSAYIGLADPDEEGIDMFRALIKEVGGLSEQVDELRTKQRAYTEDRERINREYAASLIDLENRQQCREEAEKKLTRLDRLRFEAAALDKKVKANSRIREEIESVELAEETITGLASEIRRAAGTYINSAASGILSEFTDQAYDSINAGVNYEISLNSANGMIPVQDLSAGTADQAYLAIRLATVRFIAGEDDPLPLILDDSFNLYDEERLSSSLKFLAECYRGQMLIFTCQKREKNTLDGLGIPYTEVVLT